jgi:Type III secretion protein (HpaP)
MARHIHYSALKVFQSKKTDYVPPVLFAPMQPLGKKRDFSLLRKNPNTNSQKIDPNKKETENMQALELYSECEEIVELNEMDSAEPEVERDNEMDELEEQPFNLDTFSMPDVPVVLKLNTVVDDGPIDSAVAEYIADTISRFCNDNAAQGSDDWKISIVLREDILKSTTLHMALSRDSLLLRFEAHDPGANILISKEVDRLQSMLNQSLLPQREVFITL